MNANIEAERILSRPEEEVETQIVIRTIEESKLSTVHVVPSSITCICPCKYRTQDGQNNKLIV